MRLSSMIPSLSSWRTARSIPAQALAILLVGSSLASAANVIYTKEVTYCSEGRAVNTDRFDIRYYPGNKSIGFDISARSVAANLNADLNIELFAYGKNYINITANLCTILAGALCPLPQYQFDGSFAYILPASLNIDLPAIAFTVPDLDAYAQITLTNQETGAEALCLGATLSNGHTVYMDSVRWATIGLTIVAFIVALVHSFWPLSPYKSGPEWRFATILSYFQHVAICGFLSLDYPLVYKNFTLNFVWSHGLIYAGPINRAIDRMRYKTGGTNVEGKTFSVIAENSVALFTNLTNSMLVPQDGPTNAKQYAAASAASAQHEIPQVQAAPSYNLVSGIETSTSGLGITYANAFMTVFIFFLLFCCLMIAICVVATLGVFVYSLIKGKRTGAHNLRYFSWTNWLRLVLACYTPLILFSFWQFLHEPDSGWLAVLLAALTFVWIHLVIFGIYWHLSKVAHRAVNSPDEKLSLRWSTVTHQFKKSGQGYLILLAAAAFCSAAFVAFAQGHALVQLIPLIAIELIVVIALIIWRPFANRWSNVLLIFVELFKLISYGLLIAFYAKLEYNGIIRAVLGFVVLAVQSIMTVILFIVTIYNLGAGILWGKEARDRAIQIHADAMAEKEKGTASPTIARPFLHPRTTGLEDADGNPMTSINSRGNGTANYDANVYGRNNYYGDGSGQGAGMADYSTPFSAHNAAMANGTAPPVSSLYMPAPRSPSDEGDALSAPFASSGHPFGHHAGYPGSPSLSDSRTVVADRSSSDGPGGSGSDLSAPKKHRGVKSWFTKSP